jgi:hypothetical protein
VRRTVNISAELALATTLTPVWDSPDGKLATGATAQRHPRAPLR